MITKVIGKVSPTPKGQYNSSTQYERLDIVTYQGSSYMAKQNTKGNVPTNTTYWAILAEKGSSITLSSYKNEYVLSNTNTQPQSGWSTTLPTIQPGKYLWTRTTINTTGGSSIISYSVAYQGTNGTGTGTVKSVNGVTPDSSGNVQLNISPASNLGIAVYNFGDQITDAEIRCFGYITEDSTKMFLTLIFPKLFKENSLLKITSVTGAIRNSYNGYVEGFGVNLKPYLPNNQTLWDCNVSSVDIVFVKTTGNTNSFVKSNATDVPITNNIPVAGYLTITGKILEKTT